MAASNKVSFYFFIKILAGLLLSILLCIQFIGWLENRLEQKVLFSKYWVTQRLNDSFEKLPDILKKEKDIVLVVGSSEIEVGFSPLVFNEEAKKNNSTLRAVNLGYRSIDISNTILIQRIQEVIKPYATHIKAVVIAPSLVRMTETAANSIWVKNINRNYGYSLYSGRILLHLAFENPGLALKLAFRKYMLANNAPAYLLDNMSRYMGFQYKARKMPNQWNDPRSGERPAWNEKTYGELWGYPTAEQREFFREFSSSSVAEATEASYIECCDVKNLVLSQSAVFDLKKKLNLLKKKISNIYVLYIPFAPAFKHTDLGNHNASEFLKQMQSDDSFKLLDFSQVEFSQDDYIEFMHFSIKGREIFSRALAQKLMRDLR